MNNTILLPAILFPAIPLMMAVFGSRYFSMSSLIRKIHDELINKKLPKNEKSAQRYLAQINILKKRLVLNKFMQIIAAISFIVNLIAIIFALINDFYFIYVFILAVILFTISIVFFIYELHISVNALDKHLEDLEEL